MLEISATYSTVGLLLGPTTSPSITPKATPSTRKCSGAHTRSAVQVIVTCDKKPKDLGPSFDGL